MPGTGNDPAKTELRALHERVAAELFALRDLASALEHHLEEIIGTAGASLSGAMRRDLQELDRLTQTLGCLAEFQHHLSRSLPAGFDVDLCQPLSALKLRSVADRLAGQGAPDREAQADPGAELFT